jgi:hypothetical protein
MSRGIFFPRRFIFSYASQIRIFRQSAAGIETKTEQEAEDVKKREVFPERAGWRDLT